MEYHIESAPSSFPSRVLAAVDATFFLAAAALAWVLRARMDDPDRWLMWAGGLAALVALVLALKLVTREVRPDGSNAASFPSGHAAVAAYIAQATAAVGSPGRLRDALQWGTWAWAGAVGAGRVRAQKHFVHDVLAGGLLGWAMARVVMQPRQPHPPADGAGAAQA